MLKKTVGLIIIILFSCFETPVYGVGIVEESYDRELSYSVFPVHPSTHQGDKDNLFFDLRLAPNEETTLHLKINNDGLKDEKFRINIAQATTSKTGSINYLEEKEGIHDSLDYDINDFVSYDDIVEVPAKSSIEYPIKVKCPEKTFDGIILAGVFVEIDHSSDEQETEGIVTTTGYSFALMISQNDNKLDSQIELDSVYPAVSFGETSVVAKLFNPVMKGYGGLSYHAVISKNNKEFINKHYIEKEFAPNSFCEFVIDLDNKPLMAGNYVLDLSIEDKRGNSWHFEEDFTVTKKQANEINSIAITDSKNNIRLYIFIISLTVVCIIIYIVFRRYKKINKEELI